MPSKVVAYLEALERVAALANACAEETDEDTYEVDPVRWKALLRALEQLESAECKL